MFIPSKYAGHEPRFELTKEEIIEIKEHLQAISEILGSPGQYDDDVDVPITIYPRTTYTFHIYDGYV